MTNGVSDLRVASARSQTGQTWPTVLASLVSSAALAVLGFFWLIVLSDTLMLAPRLRNLLIFAASISVLPTACAAILFIAENAKSRTARHLFDSVNVLCATATLLAVTVIGILAWRSGNIGFWQSNGLRAAKWILWLHLALLALLAFARMRPAQLRRIGATFERFRYWPAQTIGFTYSFAAAFVALFSIQPGYKYFNGLFGYFLPDAPGGFPRSSQVVIAALLAALFVLGGLSLLKVEHSEAASRSSAPSRLQKLGLTVAAVATIAMTFDFSLAADAFHYMTNIGPALHLMNGGTLMVDTFSQYGPGPVLLTYLAFQIGPPSFATANVAVQLGNILFCILFLIALWQSTRYRLAALWFGLGVIAFWLADWAYGAGNVNAAPSVLGVRYSPILLMVVAIGAGKPGQRNSWFTALASFLAAIWSVEAIVGVLAVNSCFLALLDIRERSWRRLVPDQAMACLPALAGLLALSLGVWLASGKLPAFAIYLGFLASYNPVAQFWSIPFGGEFWSWGPFLLAIAVVAAISGLPTIDKRWETRVGYGEDWLRKYLPAAMLTAITGAYFAGRSVDFTILIALLPLGLMVIPGLLWVASIALTRDRLAIGLAIIPITAFLWMYAFSWLYLFRVESPYSFIVQECRDHGRCSPSALSHGLSEALHRELALIPATHSWALSGRDLEIVKDAKNLIEKYAAGTPQVVALLGDSSSGNPMLSDVALLYTGKWHKWPVSFVFSDQLVPTLVTRILATPVPLQTGDLVVERRGNQDLARLEGAISSLIKATNTLCLLDGNRPEVVGYRLWKNGDPIPAGGCKQQETDTAPQLYYQEKETIQALAPLIGNLQRSGDAFPDGPIDLAALRRSNIAIPPQFVRGNRLTSFWGPMTIFKSGTNLTLDLFDLRDAACDAVFDGANRIASVERIAASTAATDALKRPLTHEQITKACAQNSRILRLILIVH